MATAKTDPAIETEREKSFREKAELLLADTFTRENQWGSIKPEDPAKPDDPFNNSAIITVGAASLGDDGTAQITSYTQTGPGLATLAPSDADYHPPFRCRDRGKLRNTRPTTVSSAI